MEQERLEELQEAVELMRMLDSMAKTNGWKWLMERFAALRKDYYLKLLNAATQDETMTARCAIKSLNVILSDPDLKIESDVDRLIREGKEASKEIKSVKDKSPNAQIT